MVGSKLVTLRGCESSPIKMSHPCRRGEHRVHAIRFTRSGRLSRLLRHHVGDVATCVCFYVTLSHRWANWQVYPVT